MAAREAFESLSDPPAGVASTNNHPSSRSPSSSSSNGRGKRGVEEERVYREPSTWDTMIRVELAAEEHERAVGLLRRAEERAFPEAGTFPFSFPLLPFPIEWG